MDYAIQTFGLTKHFPKGHPLKTLLPWHRPAPLVAVDQVDLTIHRGELFGLLGPNGAGKTTLVKLLCTLITPTAGTARVNGYDLRQEAAIRQSVNLVTGDERSFYWRLSGRQNLRFFAALYGLSGAELEARVEAALAQVEMLDIADQAFQTYSTGMKQRLAIARALLNNPRILFMDEPTRSLDPIAAQRLHQFIRDELVGRRGVTVFLTTHNLHEAETLCDRLAIMHRGRIRACGTIADLRALLHRGDRYTLIVSGYTPQVQDRLRHLVTSVEDQPGEGDLVTLRLDLPDTGFLLSDALDMIRDAGGRIHSVTREPIPLEEVFARLTDERTAQDHAEER